MPGQPAHFEIPADDTAKARQFWGSLFDWQFEAMPGPFEYHMTRISDQAGAAITNMEPGKRRTTRVRCRAWAGPRSAATPRGTSSVCGRTTRPPRPQPNRFHRGGRRLHQGVASRRLEPADPPSTFSSDEAVSELPVGQPPLRVADIRRPPGMLSRGNCPGA
jgi:hypothetical protein